MDRPLLGQPGPIVDELIVEQADDHRPVLVPQADDVLAEADGDLALAERPRRLHQQPGGHHHTAPLVRALGVPEELAGRDPVAVGRRHGDPDAVDVDPDTGEHGETVVPARRGRDLTGRGGEHTPAHRPGLRRHGGQAGEVLVREHEQVVLEAAAGQDGLTAVPVQVDRPIGEALGDLGEHPAGDEHPSRRGDIGLDLRPGRHLVVEDRDAQIRIRFEQQSRERGHGGPSRQQAGRPRHRIRQHVSVHPDLHCDLLAPPFGEKVTPGSDRTSGEPAKRSMRPTRARPRGNTGPRRRMHRTRGGPAGARAGHRAAGPQHPPPAAGVPRAVPPGAMTVTHTTW